MLFILVGIFLYARLLGRAQPDRGGDLMSTVTETPARRAEAPRAAARRQLARPPAPRALAVWSVLALLYLFIPVFIIIAFSFNDNQGRFNFTWQGFTLRHWQHPFADPGPREGADQLGRDRADLDRDRHRARHVHGDGARALPLPRPITVDFFVFMPLSSPRSARRGAARDVPDPVDEDVLAPRDFGVKPGAQLDERRHPPDTWTVPDVGLPIPAMSFSSELLPEPLRPMMPTVRPAARRRHAVERHERARRAAGRAGRLR